MELRDLRNLNRPLSFGLRASRPESLLSSASEETEFVKSRIYIVGGIQSLVQALPSIFGQREIVWRVPSFCTENGLTLH